MVAVLLAFLRLFHGFRRGIKDPEFQAIGLFTLLLLIFGTIFYNRVEHWNYLDAFYFCVTTLATVGFGDYAPKTDLGKIFTVMFLFLGIGTLASFINLLAKYTRK